MPFYRQETKAHEGSELPNIMQTVSEKPGVKLWPLELQTQSILLHHCPVAPSQDMGGAR